MKWGLTRPRFIFLGDYTGRFFLFSYGIILKISFLSSSNIELIPDSINAFDIFFASANLTDFTIYVADMVMDRSWRVKIIVFMPDDVYNHFIGKDSSWIRDQQ